MIKKVQSLSPVLLLVPIWLLLLPTAVAFAQAPVITTVTPAKGNVGSSVVLVGTGFDVAAANNIVWFGAVRGTVTLASATSITVTVPAGATPGPVTVLNKSTGLQAMSTTAFNVTFSGGVIDQCAFSNDLVDFASSGASVNSTTMIAADLNNDNKTELIFMATFYPYIWFVQNNSTPGAITPASFGDTLRYNIGNASTAAISIAAHDLDGDGLVDIAIGTGSPAGVTILRNTSAGSTISFAPRQQIAGASGTSMAIADLDFDGKAEIISGSTVYRNTSTPGSISFAAVTLINAVGAVAVADLDADNKFDLVYLSGGVLYASKNTGTAAPFTAAFFNTRITLAPSTLISLAVADLDGDSKPDLLTMDNFSGQDSLYIYKNVTAPNTLNSGSFLTHVGIALNFADPQGTQNAANQVTVGDMDGDGKTDIVVLDRTLIPQVNAYTVGVLANHTTPGTINAASFSKESFEVGTYVTNVLPADLDADGRLDLVTNRSNYNTYVTSAMRNTMTENSCSLTVSSTAPVISSFTPLTGAVGTSVVITGTNFNSTVSKMSVYFGGIKGTVTAGSTTSLTVTVPTGVALERIIVLDTQTRQQAMTNAYFSVTFPTHPLTAAYYNANKNFIIATNLSGAEPAYVSHADLDQDGKYDIIHRYTSFTNIHTTRNQSTSSNFSFLVDGQFSTEGIYDSPFPIVDLNGDGKPEMIASSYYTLHFWKNNYAGGLLDSTSFGTRQGRISGGFSDNLYRAEFADFDGDGRPDMVMSGYKGTFDAAGGFSILRNISANGAVAFSSKIIFPQTVNIATAVGDIDGDGKPDIITTDATATNTLLIYQNHATPGSLAPTDFSKISISLGGTAHTYGYSIYVTDLDGDGKSDIILSHIGGLTIVKNIYAGGAIAAASFATAIELTDPSFPSGDPYLKIADLDGDGKPDLITLGTNGILVYQNNTTPGVLSAASFSSTSLLGTSAWIPDVADLNGDGIPELITYAGGGMTIFYNASSLPTNSAAVLSTTTSTRVYQNTALIVDNAITVTDADDTSLAGATMTIAAGTLVPAEDELLFSNQNGISGSYNSTTGILTLTGSSLLSNYRNALRTIQYRNNATNPTTSARTITLTVTDGKDVSNIITYSISFQTTTTPGNDPPVIVAQTSHVASKGKVTIDLTQSISDPDGNLDLGTLSIVSDPVSGATATINASHQLTVDYSAVNFIGTDQLVIGVCDTDGLCTQQSIQIEVTGDIIVYNGISPNGDLLNGSFWIENIDTLPDTQKNHVTIYNRWGDSVYEIDNYDNTTRVFKGVNKNGHELPTGTYFYKIEFVGGRSTITGYISLKR